MTFQLGSALLDACVLAAKIPTAMCSRKASRQLLKSVNPRSIPFCGGCKRKAGLRRTISRIRAGSGGITPSPMQGARRLRATVPNGTFTKNKLKACCLEGKMVNNRVQFNRRQESRSPELRRDEAKFFSENTACIAQDLYYAYARALGRWL